MIRTPSLHKAWYYPCLENSQLGRKALHIQKVNASEQLKKRNGIRKFSIDILWMGS